MAEFATSNTSDTDRVNEKSYQQKVRAWAWYDWANHAYITVTASTFFPPYFIAIAAAAFLPPGAPLNSVQSMSVARDTASNVFALTVSLALFFAALLAPIIGAYADITGRRKRILVASTMVVGAIASLMFFLTTGMWLLGLILYFITQVGMNISLGLSSSLLPHIARADDMNRVSSLGYAYGYIGGGLLLAINTALYLFADRLGIDSALAVRIAFLSVGIWWIGFTIPLIRHISEPPATPLAHGTHGRGGPILDALTRIRNTIRDASRYREMFKMLIAFWFYMEGIGAIILLATSYGAALGLDTAVLISTLLMTQFVAFPYALMYGRIPIEGSHWRAFFLSMLLWSGFTFPLMGMYANLNGPLGLPLTFGLIFGNQVLGVLVSYLLGRRLLAGLVQRIDTKRAVVLGLIIYLVIPIWGFFLKTQAEFFMLGWLVGTVQGGTQALSRVIYARLTPKAKSGEFFGLYGLSEKFAGILGPFLYGVVGSITHDPRASILSITLFFLAGIFILLRVNEEKGASIASAEEAQIEFAKVAD